MFEYNSLSLPSEFKPIQKQLAVSAFPKQRPLLAARPVIAGSAPRKGLPGDVPWHSLKA